MKINVVSAALKPVASNYTAKEFLAEAHARFPQPSPFLAEFLQRFETLAELDEQVEKRHFEEAQPADIDCPACGMAISVEVEFDLEFDR